MTGRVKVSFGIRGTEYDDLSGLHQEIIKSHSAWLQNMARNHLKLIAERASQMVEEEIKKRVLKTNETSKRSQDVLARSWEYEIIVSGPKAAATMGFVTLISKAKNPSGKPYAYYVDQGTGESDGRFIPKLARLKGEDTVRGESEAVYEIRGMKKGRKTPKNTEAGIRKAQAGIREEVRIGAKGKSMLSGKPATLNDPLEVHHKIPVASMRQIHWSEKDSWPGWTKPNQKQNLTAILRSEHTGRRGLHAVQGSQVTRMPKRDRFVIEKLGLAGRITASIGGVTARRYDIAKHEKKYRKRSTQAKVKTNMGKRLKTGTRKKKGTHPGIRGMKYINEVLARMKKENVVGNLLIRAIRGTRAGAFNR